MPDDVRVGFSASRPSVARIYDYWLGCKDNFAADREAAERVLAVYPPLVRMVRENRLFLSHSVSWLASEGLVMHFLDPDTGRRVTRRLVDLVASGSYLGQASCAQDRPRPCRGWTEARKRH